jgi:hypothetical protein
MSLNQIYEGWRNRLIPPEDLKAQIEAVSGQRMTICRDCPHHSSFHFTPLRPDEHCTQCGCTLAAKTACLSCQCPIDKWLAELTPEEEKNIENDETRAI